MFLIPYSIGACIAVFTICIIIELLRIYTVEKVYMKIVYKIESKINNILDKFMNLKIIKQL